MTLSDSQIKIMQEDLAIELANILIDEKKLSLQEALSVLYNSQTFDRLSNPASGLYYQSTGYVYSFLQKEMETGSLV